MPPGPIEVSGCMTQGLLRAIWYSLPKMKTYRLKDLFRFKACSLPTLDGVQQYNGPPAGPISLCPGLETTVLNMEDLSNGSLLSSHDHLVKMWDQRSHKTPLFELTGIFHDTV